MRSSIAVIGILFLSATSIAKSNLSPSKDLGFRYIDGKCVNSKGEIGLNPSIFGQCSDLRGVILSKFDFSEIDFSGSQMSGSSFERSSFMGATLTGVNFEGSNLNGVNLDSTKLVNTNFKKAMLRNVTLVDAEILNSDFSSADFRTSNLSYLTAKSSSFVKSNFQSVPLDQAAIMNCDFSEADLSKTTISSGQFENSKLEKANLQNSNLIKVNFMGSNLDRAAFQGSILRYANFSKASIKNANLKNISFSQVKFNESDLAGSDVRGADFATVDLETVNLKEVLFSKRTMLPFSNEEAMTRGMVFKKSNSILILPDARTASLDVFAQALIDLGDEVKVSSKLEYQFDGTESLSPYDVVIHMNAQTYDQDIPMAGQMALVNFVKGGGVFAYGEWNSYEFGNGRMTGMKDLNLYMLEDTIGTTTLSLNPTEDGTKSGILEELPETFSIPISGYTNGALVVFEEQQTKVLMQEPGGLPLVAARPFGKGTVVGFRFNCTESQAGGNCLRNKNLQRLYFNAGYLAF